MTTDRPQGAHVFLDYVNAFLEAKMTTSGSFRRCGKPLPKARLRRSMPTSLRLMEAPRRRGLRRWC